MKQSRKNCGCTPWDYPQVLENNGNDVLCDGVNAHCFENEMHKAFNASSCDCLPNCNEIRFGAEVSVEQVNAWKECSNADGIFKASCRQKGNSTILVKNKFDFLIKYHAY